MKPELDKSLLRQFHAPIVDGAKGEEGTRAIPPLSGTINAPVEYLDLATVIKVLQAVSGEIVQEKQLEILLRTALEQAGAERGVLVLSPWTEPRVAAQATTGDGGIVVKLHDEAMTLAVLPESVIQYVVRTNESVILDDAAAQNPFSADPYIRQQHARSILCLPFLNRGELIGVLYLENNLTPGGFTPARIAVLKLLASQAAISLENARLYRDLAEREAKIRRLVEAQTPRAEDELRAIVDNAPVFLWSDLPDGYCDFLNQPWLTYFNLSLQEAQGAGWATVLHPDDVAHHLESWQKSVSTGIPFEAEARYRRSDGEYRWFLNRANPLRDQTGRIVKWYGTNIDIENLKRTEARLRQSEAYLAEAQRLSHTGSFGWKPDTDEIIWSAETYRIFEYDRAVTPTIDLVAQRVHPEDRADFQSVIERASGGASDLEHAYRLLLPDGRVKHVHALAHATRDASGNREFVGAVTDITERKTAEEALRSSEAYLAEAQRISHTGSWANTANGEPKYWSEENYRVLGFDPAEPLPSLETIFQRIHPDDRAAMREQLARGIRDKADFEVDMRFVHPITGIRNIRSICHAVLDRCGDLREMVGTVIDITERKRAEEALLQQKAYLDELFDLAPDAIVLTTLRNPVNVRINKEFTRMFGYAAEEAVGRRLRDLIAPSDLQPANLTENADLLAGRTVQKEVIRQRKDGNRFHAHITAKRIRLADSEDAAYIIYRDITARKCAEEELRRSQHYLAEAQRLSHTGSWAWSPVSNAILYWSEECYRILGYDPAQGLPSFESSFQRIHPEDRPVLAATIERAVREKAEFQIDYRLLLPDGTARNVRILSHPVLDASGKVIEFVGTVMDVTEQKRASQERRAHLWFLQSMDRINRAMQRSNDVELMTSGVMQEALEIFACDRACLIYPCDPDAPTYRTVMEHTSPEYGGALSLGQNLSVTPEWGEAVRRVLHHPEAVVNPSVSPGSRERYRVASMLAIAVRPKGDRPYLFAVHSERSRPWTAAEVRLFEETARRLGDALTSVLAHRNLLAREEQLRRSQHYLAEAQRLSHIGSWAFNVTGFGYWSPELFRIYGLDPGAKAPSTPEYLALVHPEDRDFVVQVIEKVLASAEGFDFTKRIIRPDGAIRHVRCVSRRATTGGIVQEIVGTAMDVTEEMRAEEERRAHLWFLESMDRINRAMHRTNDVEGMMSGVLEETLAIFGSDRAWLVYPCDPDAATSRVVMEHTRPEYPGAFALGEEFPVDTQAAELLRRVLDGPGTATDLSVPPEIRKRFSIESMIAIAVRPKGDRPYLFGLHQCSHARTWTAAERRLFEEIARRLEDALTSVLAHRNLLASQEELLTSEQRFRTFVDHATDAFFLFDDEDIVRDVNRQACESLGYTREELIGMHPSQFNAGLTPEKVDWVRQRLHEHGNATFNNLRRRKDGSVFPVEVRVRTFDRGGRRFAIALATDITERKHAEAERLKLQERLRQAEKMEAIGRFASGIAHDFNNVLGGILAYVEMLLDEAPENTPRRRYAQNVLTAATRGRELVDQILAYTRSQRGKRVPTDVGRTVAETLELVRSSLPARITLYPTIPDKPLLVSGDATQLHQIVMNLCSNSIHAMKAGGPLRVAITPAVIGSERALSHGTLVAGRYVRVSVEDSGCGMDEATVARIFEPFFTTKEVGRGTGLGLALVFAIVNDFGGAIDVRSVPDEGTTFSIYLPLAEMLTTTAAAT